MNGWNKWCRAIIRLLVLVAAVGFLSACGLISNPPSVGSVAKAANPLNWFGDDEPDLPDPLTETTAPRPESSLVGTVHMVDRSNKFLLIHASRNTTIEYGTSLISQNPQGRQTAELKLSPERIGAFLVADIVKGHPDVDDQVKLLGATDAEGDGVVPIGGDEVQVLE